MTTRADDPQSIPPEILEIVRKQLRRKLGVSLSKSDGRSLNQDALELENGILMEIHRDRDRADDLRKYASRLAENRIADYLSSVKVAYTKLSDRLRYYLRNAPTAGFALWEDETGESFCGYSGWAGGRRSRADAARIDALISGRARLDLAGIPTGNPEHLDRDDWERALSAIFDHLDGVVSLRLCLKVVAAVLQIRDYEMGSLDDGEEDGQEMRDKVRSTQPLADRQVEVRQTLQRLWSEILELLPRQRMAYLLNPTDGELEVFVANEIASEAEIGRAVGLTIEQYEVLWSHLDLSPSSRDSVSRSANDDERFVVLWGFLPLDDLMISRLIGGTRNQTIGLRKCARERLQRRLVAWMSGGKK